MSLRPPQPSPSTAYDTWYPGRGGKAWCLLEVQVHKAPRHRAFAVLPFERPMLDLWINLKQTVYTNEPWNWVPMFSLLLSTKIALKVTERSMTVSCYNF